MTPERRQQIEQQLDRHCMDTTLQIIAEELEDRYDGAPDSKTLWMADIIDQLRVAAERVAKVRKGLGLYPSD